MNISIIGSDAQAITVGCDCAYLVNSENTLAMKFENDVVARTNEEMMKKLNLKTKHNDCEITVKNISDYNLTFN